MEIFGLQGIGEVRAGDDLAGLLIESLTAGGRRLLDDDILVVSSKVVSKAEGRVVAADTREAQITAETVRRVAARRTPRGLAQIVEAAAGPVMAAAGVDASNVAPGTVLLLPKDPDSSARALRARLRSLTGARVAVILSDTAGRAWRDGQTDFALGAAGVLVTDDLRGALDTHGQSLEVTVRALADELAAAADLVKGKLTAVPAALVRGCPAAVTDDDGPGAAVLLRTAREDWFRYGHVEAVTASLGIDPADAEPPTVPPGPVEDRLHRAVSLALHAPGPLTPGTDPAHFHTELSGHTATLTPAGTTAADWVALGALAQRLTATTWAEDLTITLTLFTDPPSLKLTATPAG
jgi:coenzyme F420-0:L-glutamate ligase/coenzyme F420-1:gamma-L-glutamate ligase